MRPYPLTDFKVFRAELTGLWPGDRLQFRIGKQSPTYRFRTMPAKATDTIHFISGGDCGVNAHAVANNIQAARQDPMFAVIGGDLGYDNGRSVDISLAFLRNYSKHMVGRDGRLIPLVACIGNHEVDGGYNKPRQGAVLLRPLRRPLPGHRLRHARLRRLPEPGAARHRPHHADRRRTDRLAGEDAQGAGRSSRTCSWSTTCRPIRRSARWRATTAKHGTGEGNRKHWVPLFEKYRVPVVLEHHDHTFKRTKPLLDGLAHDNGVLYLGDGSWGRLRAPQKPEKLSILAAQPARLSPVAASHPGRGALPPGPGRERPGHGRLPQRAADNRQFLRAVSKPGTTVPIFRCPGRKMGLSPSPSSFETRLGPVPIEFAGHSMISNSTGAVSALPTQVCWPSMDCEIEFS